MTIIQRAALSSIAFIAAEALCLFSAAGRTDIPEFWLYLALTAALSAATMPTVDPDLMAERMRPGGKALSLRMWGVMAVVVAHFLIAGYDRGRLHFAGGVPAAVGLLAIPMLLWRCIGEDRMLRAGLPGYAEYAARVRWRLIPGIW